MIEYYAAADLLVLPSDRETWGMVVHEAMAAALPVVVSSRELGRTKPDPVCYQIAAGRLGLPVESVA